jgi:hypothetical protein
MDRKKTVSPANFMIWAGQDQTEFRIGFAGDSFQCLLNDALHDSNTPAFSY